MMNHRQTHQTLEIILNRLAQVQQKGIKQTPSTLVMANRQETVLMMTINHQKKNKENKNETHDWPKI